MSRVLGWMEAFLQFFTKCDEQKSPFGTLQVIQVVHVPFLFERVGILEYQCVARQQDCCMARSCDICV